MESVSYTSYLINLAVSHACGLNGRLRHALIGLLTHNKAAKRSNFVRRESKGFRGKRNARSGLNILFFRCVTFPYFPSWVCDASYMQPNYHKFTLNSGKKRRRQRHPFSQRMGEERVGSIFASYTSLRWAPFTTVPGNVCYPRSWMAETNVIWLNFISRFNSWRD